MKIANFTDNMWISAFRALDLYSKVIGEIIVEGQKLLHVNVVDRFVQLEA